MRRSCGVRAHIGGRTSGLKIRFTVSYIGIVYIYKPAISATADMYFVVRVTRRETARKQREYVHASAGESREVWYVVNY